MSEGRRLPGNFGARNDSEVDSEVEQTTPRLSANSNTKTYLGAYRQADSEVAPSGGLAVLDDGPASESLGLALGQRLSR